MSIESDLHDIATSLAAIANHIISVKYEQRESAPVPPVSAAVPASPLPAAAPTPVPAPAPAPVPQQSCPLTDNNTVMSYCMEKYRTLGPIKGGLIQEVLISLGHSSLNSLRPDQYAEFYSRVEAIQ